MIKLRIAACLCGLLWLTACTTTPRYISKTPTAKPRSESRVKTPKSAPAYPGPAQRSEPPMQRSGPLPPLKQDEVSTNASSSSTSTSTSSTSAEASTSTTTDAAATTPPVDMWERIRNGFAMPDLENDLVSEREQWYTARPDYMLRMTERSSKYLFHIVEELERRGMPTELALLPYIESAFNPQAVSSAKAAGMWQFMPATGADYQLRQNAFRDDRRDVLASTTAALDYLQRLHRLFGDWHLALAAYNWGEGSVGRAIARNQKAGLPTGYQDLKMPAETRLYVPKLQAVKNIVADPERYSAELPPIENHPYFQSVQVTRDIDVALAAQLADIKLEDFKALNPSMHRPVIMAAGTPQILLPWDNAAVFQRNFDAHGQGQYASWTAWTLPKTMSVAAIARQVGMSESALRSMNRIPPNKLVRAGSALIVPRSTQHRADVSSQVADNGQMLLAPMVATRRTLVKAGRKDNTVSLARRYSVSASDIAQWNDVSPGSRFKLGQQVVLHLPVRAKANAKAKTKPGASRSSAASKGKTKPGKRGGTAVKKKR